MAGPSPSAARLIQAQRVTAGWSLLAALRLAFRRGPPHPPSISLFLTVRRQPCGEPFARFFCHVYVARAALPANGLAMLHCCIGETIPFLDTSQSLGSRNTRTPSSSGVRQISGWHGVRESPRGRDCLEEDVLVIHRSAAVETAVSNHHPIGFRNCVMEFPLILPVRVRSSPAVVWSGHLHVAPSRLYDPLSS